MDTELTRLINRTELAADRAERDGFFATAEALRDVVFTLSNVHPMAPPNTKALQYIH